MLNPAPTIADQYVAPLTIVNACPGWTRSAGELSPGHQPAIPEGGVAQLAEVTVNHAWALTAVPTGLETATV
jgi:hypothetical protein